MFWIWVSIGCFLVLSEILLPGLVAIFIGLGALTVAALAQLGFVTDLIPQLLVWFSTSLIYIFTLRILVIKLYPSDTLVQNIDEDALAIGMVVRVTESMDSDNTGRVSYEGSSWLAQSHDGSKIEVGVEVKIVGRDNIRWIVEKI